MPASLHEDLDSNTTELLNRILGGIQEIGYLEALLKLYIPDLTDLEAKYLVSTLNLKVLRYLKDTYISIAIDDYKQASNKGLVAIEEISEAICNDYMIIRFKIIYPEARKALIQCLVLAQLMDICKDHKKYSLGLKFYTLFTEIRTFARTYKPHPNAHGSFARKSIADVLAIYIWSYDVSKILMPIHVARMIKEMINLPQEAETIADWLHETNSIPSEVKQKIKKNNLPRKEADLLQQQALKELIKEQFINDLELNVNLCNYIQ